MTRRGRLVDDEQRQAAVAGRPIGISPGEQHEEVGAAREGGPRLHATHEPAAVGRGRCHFHARDVGSVVGLGDHDADHQLAARDAREPRLLLRLGAARDERAGEDLRAGHERAADTERSSRQLLRRDDHADVVGFATGREPVVLLRHRESEAADLGEARDDVLGHVAVRAVHVLGDGADLVVREAPERVGDQLEVGAEVGRAGAMLRALVGERLEEGGGTVGGDEVVRGREHPRIDAPEGLATDEARDDVADRVGHVGPRQHRFDLAVLGVPAHDARGLDGRRGVREVVRGHLLLVELVDRQLAVANARVGQVRDGAVDDRRRQIDRDEGLPFLVRAHARTIQTGRPAGGMRVLEKRYGCFVVVGVVLGTVGLGAVVATGTVEGRVVAATVVGTADDGGAAVVGEAGGEVVAVEPVCGR